ncbi:MAG: deoxyribodipyrimidine photo-lyase [Bacteroidales bacterium]
MFTTSVVWFRRDLRLHDNHAILQALEQSKQVIFLFVFDTAILSDLQDRDDARVTFIYDTLLLLKDQLEHLGATLFVLHGKPEEEIPAFMEAQKAQAIFANTDYEPYALQRDAKINKMLTAKGKSFLLYKDQVVLGPHEVLKDDGKPYTVYTPYMKKWKSGFQEALLNPYLSDGDLLIQRLKPAPKQSMPSLKQLGFIRSSLQVPEPVFDADFLLHYQETRNLPQHNTSRLGVHLRFGTRSIREVMKRALKYSETFMNELIWREFYMMILWHYPNVVTQSFKSKYDRINWRNEEQEFEKWCKGNTGFPMVDAGMRQLNSTGFMHNRVRMVVASFLVKDLLIDWRWGEAYFAQKLLDYELASNNGGWQWAAGSGCDAAPYFRIFNPESQQKKFDPEYTYIKRWVPELETDKYSQPMVNHKEARLRALSVYKKALQ